MSDVDSFKKTENQGDRPDDKMDKNQMSTDRISTSDVGCSNNDDNMDIDQMRNSNYAMSTFDQEPYSNSTIGPRFTYNDPRLNSITTFNEKRNCISSTGINDNASRMSPITTLEKVVNNNSSMGIRPIEKMKLGVQLKALFYKRLFFIKSNVVIHAIQVSQKQKK